jgi:hypothetical protein
LGALAVVERNTGGEMSRADEMIADCLPEAERIVTLEILAESAAPFPPKIISSP